MYPPLFSHFLQNIPICFIKLSTPGSLHAKKNLILTLESKLKHYIKVSLWNSLGFRIMLRIKKDIT